MAGDYDRETWGNKPPWERPKWARFLRAKRGRETQEAFLARLAKWGRRLSPGYLSELERGSKPINDDWQTVFRAFLGSGPEQWDDPWEQPQPLGGDLSAVVAAISSQTEAMRELVAELKEEREARQGRDEGLAAALALLANTLERLQPVRDGKSRTNNG